MPRIPHIHLNGSDPQQLLEAYADVGRALIELAEKINAAAPNARDYYPLGDEAYQHARNECAANLAALDKLRIYYREMIVGIQSQMDQRDTQRMRKAKP